MSVVIDGATGVTAPAFDGAVDAADLTGNVDAARITTALNASGSAPIYACRAWVNFNGTGTVAIRAAGNVSSITDNGTGDYTVNFTTAMPDANFAVVMSSKGENNATINSNNNPRPTAYSLATTSGVRIFTCSLATVALDAENISVAIFR
jgi:hypothetical protein